MLSCAPVFVQQRIRWHAQLLVVGALLIPGQRTISGILQIIGPRWKRHRVNFQRVLNRAVPDSRHGARLLLVLLIVGSADRHLRAKRSGRAAAMAGGAPDRI